MFKCNSEGVRRICSRKKLNGYPDQKTILIEQDYDELKSLCSKFQKQPGATDMEVKTLLRKLFGVWKKNID